MIPKKLLIVEDDQDVAEAILDTLELPGVEILVARNGVEALERLKTEPISAVLSDLNMPKMSGLELLEKLRAQGMITPFVILTAFTDKSNIVSSLRFGCFDFLEKPFDLTKLASIVDRALTFGHALLQLQKVYENLFSRPGNHEEMQRIRELQLIMASSRYSVAYEKLEPNQ